MNIIKYFKIIDVFFLELDKIHITHFFKVKGINPLRVIGLTNNFPSLKLKNEDLLLMYSLNGNKEDLYLLITNNYVHTKQESFSLKESLKKIEKLTNIPESHIKQLTKIINNIILLNNDEKRNLSSFTNKFKDFLNKKESQNKEFNIDFEFLQILKHEGEKIEQLAEDLNSNNGFNNAINHIINKSNDAIIFKAEHIILQDIIKIYNLIYPVSDEKDIATDAKIKFTLAFLFEKLQGKDIISSISIERINEFVLSEKFDVNINQIKKATFFNLGQNYKNEFLLPAILKRLNSSHFTNSGTFLYRIASLIAKADGNITKEEQQTLTKIEGKLKHPKYKIQGVTQKEIEENETLEDVMEELNQLIGLDNIKQSITELSNFLKIQKLREEKGLKSVNNSLHSVFMGPPGTGKTTVARLVSKIYKHLGYLDKGHLIETDRSGMVAGYVGQTALKVEEIVTAAMNGVLFIDEAYALTNGNKKDFGNEAIEVLLKKMEDHRKNLIVIVAGYPDEMQEFIRANPGLQSRFNRYFNFNHYKPLELMGIFELFCNKNDFKLKEDAKDKLQFIFDKLYEKRHKSFGNGRVSRNLFEKIIEYQANRIVSITPITEDLLKNITEEDIPPVNKTVDEYLRFQKEEN